MELPTGADPGARTARRNMPRVVLYLHTMATRLPPPAVAGACAALLAAIFAADVATGPEYASFALYLVPIAIASWYLGGRWSAVAVVLAAAGWLAADHFTGRMYHNVVAEYWNGFMRIGLFMVTAYALSSLREVLSHERELARTDALTGLANRRSYIELALHELARADRSGLPLTIALLDIDDFKGVNDVKGHVAGDALLRDVGRVLTASVRESDVVARLGGDEFALLLPEVDGSGAEIALARLLDALNGLVERGGWGVGFSIGAVTTGSSSATFEDLLRQADAALYDAKARGGNCIAAAEQPAGG